MYKRWRAVPAPRTEVLHENNQARFERLEQIRDFRNVLRESTVVMKSAKENRSSHRLPAELPSRPSAVLELFVPVPNGHTNSNER